MKFGLTQETSLAQTQTFIINNMSKNLRAFFEEKDYGLDVKEILIGIISVRPQAEKFFKVRKPSYIDFKIIKDGIGNPVEISKNLGWDVKPDYELLKDLEGIALQSIVAKAILESFNDLKLPKKVKDFNLLAFKNDLEKLFIENKLV
ncbi:MAG: hypothetical protein BGO31_20810 [Bacteroidetes bacterium 43-16]|uniref:hypothetical protein n=1 Tax=uncultured Dysgonomonas sp. TaxID=206096 RepID=UPI000925A235|nr:hypothetical protein [uncultured Dysgonomonas sp.]OJV55373.1 MAG: hypothetical protein BGO31_20810 [Bacteroidetes bacterium 43-16]